jgi:hypothetical protein
MTFRCIFVRSPAAEPPCYPPPPSAVLLLLQTSPRAGEVQPGCGSQSDAVPVRIPIGFWSRALESEGGGGFTVGPSLSLFLSGLLALHRSEQVHETRRLYSAVTHHTSNTRHVPGSSYLYLVGLPLLIRK